MYSVDTYKSYLLGHFGKCIFWILISTLVLSLILFFTPRIDGGKSVEYITISELNQYLLNTTPESMAAFKTWWEQERLEHHFNEPLIFQYGRWLGDVFTGNWGESYLGSSYYSK